MFALIVFGGSLFLGALLGAAFARGLWRTYAVFGAGLLFAAGLVLWAYLSAPPDYQHSNGTEGRQYWGRWWDPDFVFVLAGLGYVCWLIGVGVGAFVGMGGQVDTTGEGLLRGS